MIVNNEITVEQILSKMSFWVFERFYIFVLNRHSRLNLRLYLLLLFCLLSINYCLFAQAPYLRQITDRDGLPSMIVYDIMQASDGYLWLGTEAGICRYNGSHFEVFTVPNARGNSFSGLQEDSQGRVYFLTFGDQLFYIDQQKNVQELLLPEKVQKFGFQEFLIDAEDNIWLSSETGNIFFKKRTAATWQDLSYLLGIRPFFSRFHKDNQGNIWIIGMTHAYQVTSKAQIISKISLPENVEGVLMFQNQLVTTRKDIEEINFYDFKTQKWQSIPINDTRYTTTQKPELKLTNIDNEELWLQANQGIAAYSWKDKKITDVFLKDKFVSNVIKDREGNYWFTTIGSGIFMLSNRELLYFNTSNSLLPSEQVNCLSEDESGNLLIGTNGKHVLHYNTKSQQLTQQYQLAKGDIECLLFDKQSHTLYVENNHLYFFDPSTKQESRRVMAGSTPKDLAVYQGKYLLVAAGHSARMLPLKTYTLPSAYLKKYENQLNKQQGVVLRRKRSRAICADFLHNGFWVGYADGLYYYSNAQSYELKTQNRQNIIAISIECDQEGIIWIGTAQQGIFAIKNQKIILHLDKTQGLVSNKCRVLRKGDELYIGTDKGLQVYHLKTKKSRIFNQEDGLPSNEIRDLIVQKNKIYLATTAGFSVLSRNFNTTNLCPPLIYLKGIALKNNSLKLLPEYQLAYNENNLRIDFTGITFRSGGKFHYKYRMKGLDESWTYSSNNFARYSALPSGTYQFQVKTVNEDNIESIETATTEIVIAYPLWKKWWFIVAVTLVGLILVSILFVYRIRAIRRKNNLEKALDTATLESLKLQMNPHFIFNAMAAIQRYMIKNDAQQTSNYLARFARLMRAVLENSRSEYISLAQEIEMLENYLTLQNLQYQGHFGYKINVASNLDPEEFAIPPMFAQPFIENAIEHGITHMKTSGIIIINFALHQDTISMEINDNGVGFGQTSSTKQSKDKKHQSLATKITRERIDLYQQSLKKNIGFKINSSTNGTQVLFYLPYKII